MVRLLLYTQADNAYLAPILWGIGILVLIFMIVFIFVQRRTGKRLESELEELDKARQENIEYEFVLRAMQIATWHIDPQRRTLSYDADYRDGREQLVYVNNYPMDLIWDAVERSDAERLKKAIEELISGRRDYYHETYRMKMGNSGMLYWEESFATIASRDEDGVPTKIVGTSMRIDAQKEMEMALISARNKAEESDRLKTAFLANMGHEIRTPLNAIVGFADLLPVVESEEDRSQLIGEIRKNNHKLLQIIDGLVSMSKVEAEAKSLVKSQTDIVPLLRQLADTTAQIIDTTQVTMITQFPYPELMITTDANRLTEVVKSLLDNAVKFTEKGSITLGFDIAEGNHLLLWVSDTGKGIDKSDHERIFERFVKVDEYIPGTGLGLSVAKSHVENLGGKITVESALGEGATFRVELPLI